jgi:hypothetical protein
MYTLHYWINSAPDLPTPYPDLDDALRRANQLWAVIDKRCHVEFKIVSDDGSILEHAAIMDEIDRRPDDLKIPPKRR